MSLKKIAELAGTSVSTVSRVLNSPGHNCQKPGLTEKIWEIADSIHYVPNPSARTLRLTPDSPKPAFTVDIFLTRFDSMDKDYFFRELFWHLKEELMQHECLLGESLTTVDIMSLRQNSGALEQIPLSGKTRSLFPSISEKKNTGLLILGKCPRKLTPLLKKRYSCIAGIDRNPTDFEYDEVICNGMTAAEKAVNYLISLGHREIAYIGDCTYETRYIGYYQALVSHSLPFDYANIHPTDQTREEGFHAMASILSSSRRPSAIFCANDSTALGVLDALKKNRKRGYFPSIISIDNIKDSQKTSPMLTTIDIPKKEMAHHALRLLLDRKNGGHQEPVRMELPCRLMERESCTWHL